MLPAPMRLNREAIGILALFCFVLVTSQAFAQLRTLNEPVSIFGICRLIETEARQNGLPPAYFARLIWKESRFDPNAVSPAGAQGIAQFMPATAERRGLDDPFNPRKAIPKSAEYLGYLRVNFGNLGLAAAAYNAGEERVSQWLSGATTLPLETENYVLEITGEPAETFRDRRRQVEQKPLSKARSFQDACVGLPLGADSGSSMAQTFVMPWAVQVAGHFQRAVAERKWANIKTRNGSLIGARPVAVSQLPTSRGSRPIYAVRIGEESRSAANALCSQLKARGTPCIVRKN